MKTLCSALLECMILPLQDKLEEWRKNVGILDKEHAKEYKKVHFIFINRINIYIKNKDIIHK